MSLSNILAVLLVVVGWMITHLFSEARERRKELRVQIEKLHELVYLIEKEAIHFHCATEFKPVENEELITKLFTLERVLTRVLDIDQFIARIIFYRRAITLDNFNLTSFIQQPRESEIIFRISRTSQDMEDAVERYYLSRYPNTIPFINLWALRKPSECIEKF